MSRYLKKLEDGECPDGLDLDYPTLWTQFCMTNEEVDTVYAPFYASVREYRNALKTREASRAKARMGQWPWAYADLVIQYR